MNTTPIEREGRPSLVAAVAVGILGCMLFGGFALLVFLLPERLQLGHWVGGGILAALAGAIIPYQLLDALSRKHVLANQALIYRHGVLSRYETEIPFANIQAVTVRQGLLQRIFDCGDLRVAAQGIANGLPLSSCDINSISIRSIPDFRVVSDAIRAGMKR